MKRILPAILVTALMILMCGCGGTAQSRTVTVPTSFAFKVKTQYNNLSVEADVEHYSAGLSKITLLAPATLKGIAVDWSDGQTKISYMGVEVNIDFATYPEASFIPAIIEFMDRFSTQGEITLQNDASGNLSEYRGDTSYGEYIVKINPVTGVPESVEFASLAMMISIYDFSRLDIATWWPHE